MRRRLAEQEQHDLLQMNKGEDICCRTCGYALGVDEYPSVTTTVEDECELGGKYTLDREPM